MHKQSVCIANLANLNWVYSEGSGTKTLHFDLPDLIIQLQYHINEQDSLPTEILNDISKPHTHGHTDAYLAFISIDAK